MSKYLPTVGIETHIQLKTKTKLFAAVDNDARDAEPNSLISHICAALPGALPVLNEAAIELSTKAALALGVEPQPFSFFERKHYFYPDSPKGYQITQYQAPILKGGFVEITVDGQTKKIGIERANLEEDAGKNIHPAGADYSLVDLNRVGTPLLEIVSNPDINSPSEAKAYCRELWLLMRYAGVTDGDLYHGHVRFDVNISLGQDGKLGTRSEIKNLNSFRSVEAAIKFEIERQTGLLEKGEKVVQETRGWDEAKQVTVSQRSKEEAEDYRYMPEPDVPPVELDAQYIGKIRGSLGPSLSDIRQKLSKLDVDQKVVEDILDHPEFIARLMEAIEKSESTIVRRLIFQLQENPEAIELKLEDQIAIAEMVENGEVSSSAAKTLLAETIIVGGDPRTVAQKLGIAQMSDENELAAIVQKIIDNKPEVVADVLAGQEKAIEFLVGQVMSETKGQANPAIVQQLIRKLLKK